MLRRNQPLIILGAGLVLIVGAIAAWLLLSGGDDDPDVSGTVIEGEKPSTSTEGTTGGPERINDGPASRWNLLLGELPENYEVDASLTFTSNITVFASEYWFKTEAEGRQKAEEFQISDQFTAVYQPTGLDADLLRGEAYVTVETYLFANVEGAKKAWAHFDNVLKSTRGSDAVKTKGLANDSSAYRIAEGTIGTSEMLQVYHRYSFRRGNVIVSVMTRGGQPFFNIDTARRFAVIIDNKLLGTRPAEEPTPIPTPSFGIGN